MTGSVCVVCCECGGVEGLRQAARGTCWVALCIWYGVCSECGVSECGLGCVVCCEWGCGSVCVV